MIKHRRLYESEVSKGLTEEEIERLNDEIRECEEIDIGYVDEICPELIELHFPSFKAETVTQVKPLPDAAEETRDQAYSNAEYDSYADVFRGIGTYGIEAYLSKFYKSTDPATQYLLDRGYISYEEACYWDFSASGNKDDRRPLYELGDGEIVDGECYGSIYFKP